MATSKYNLTDEDLALLYGNRPVAEQNKKQKPPKSYSLSEDDLKLLYGEDYGTTQERAGAKPSGSDVASVALVQGREGSVSQPDRQVVTNSPWVGKFGQAPTYGTSGPSVTEVPTAIVDIAETTPALYRESNRMADYGRALREFNQTGRITLEQPKLSNQFGVARLGQAPVYEGGKVLEGAEAEAYLAQIAAPTEDTAKVTGFRETSGPVTRGIAGALSQPEQAYSLAGAIAGGLVGQPMLGAAIGMTPALEKMVYTEYASNKASGMSEEDAWNNAIAKLPVEALTEMVPGFGKVAKAGVGGAMLAGGGEEALASLGGMAVDKAFQQISETPELFEQKLPQSFGEGLSEVAESAVGGAFGAGVIRGAVSAPSAAVKGVETAREFIQRARDESTLKSLRTGIRPAKMDVEPTPAVELPKVTAPDVAQEAKPKTPSKNSLKRAKADVADRLVNDPEFASIALADPAVLSVEEVRLARQYDVEIEAKKAKEAQAKAEAPAQTQVVEPAATPATPTGPLTPEMRRARMEGPSRAEALGMRSEAPVTAQEPVATPPATPVAPSVVETSVEAPSAPQAGARRTTPVTRQEMLRDSGLVAPQAGPTGPLTPEQRRARGAGLSRAEALGMRLGTTATQPAADVPSSTTVPTSAEVQTSVPDVTPVATTQPQETTNGLQQIQEGQRAQGRREEAVGVSQPEQDDGVDLSVSKEPAPQEGTYTSKEEFTAELESGFLDVDATEAKKIKDKIVLYSGPEDLASIDPVVAAAVEQGVKKVDPNATVDQIKGFQHKGKVYVNISKNKKGSAKSILLHEARVHLAGKAEPERVGSLASRVEALARLGNADATAAVETVNKEYPAIVTAAKGGNTSALSRQKEEVLADFVQRIWERTKGGSGLTGTIKRLYTDAVSYFRDRISAGLKVLGGAVGRDWGLTINETDILDAIRYGRTAASFKDAPEPAQPVADDGSPSFAVAPNAAPNATPPANPPDVTEGFTNKDKAVRVLQRLFRASGEGSQTVFEMTQRAGGIVSAWQNEMQNAMISAYDRLGSRAKIYNDEMVKYFNGQPAKLPKDVRDALDEMRMVRKKAVIALVASGVIKDRRTRARLLESADYYTHRSYAAWQLPKGEWSEIMRAPGGRFQEVFESVADQIVDDIRLGTPDTVDDMYSKMTSKDQPKKVQKLIEDVLRFKFYAHGITNPSNKAEWEVAIARLKAAAVTQSTDPEALKSMAKDIALRVLDPKADRVEERDVQKYMRALGVDSTALKDRTGVRPWMRELWGEYKELDAIAFDTITNLAGIIAREQAMRTYKQELLDKKILIPGDAGSKSGYQQLKSDDRSYGPFEGLWIRDQDSGIVNMIASQNVMDAVMQYNNMLMGGALGSALSTVGGYTKTAAILQDHTAMMNNMLSTATVLTLAAGNPFVWAKLPKAVGIARRTDLRTIPVLGKATKITDAQIAQDIKFLAEQNVLFDAALTQDLREEISFAIRDESYLNAPKLKRRLFKAKVAVGRFQDNLSRLNAAGDTIGKVMVFYAKIPALQLVYPEKSLQEIRQIAASEIRDQMPSYSRAMPLARAVSRQGLFAPFATFYSEMIRNTANDGKLFWKYAKLAVTEKNPAAAAYASLIGAGSVAKHTAIYAAHAGLAGLAFWAYSMFAEDEEDEELIEQIKQAQTAFRDNYIDVRKLAAEHVRGDIIPLRALGEFKYRVAVTNRMDPSTVGATLSSWEKGDDAGTIISTFLSGLSGLSIPAQEAVRAFTSSEEDRMENIGWSILRMFSPGAVTRLVTNPMEDERKGRDPLNSFELNLESMGFRLQDIDAAESLVRHSREAAQPIRTATRDLNDALNPKIKTRGEFYLNMDAVATAYNGVVNSYVEAYDKVYPVINTARNLGMTNAQIFDVIKKENTGLSDDFIFDTINGRIRFPHPSKLLENKLEPERRKARTRQEQDRITTKFVPEFKRANELYEEAVERAEKLGIPVVGGKK